MSDIINRPKHYTGGAVECIDAIESATWNLSGIEAVCTANVIKYVWRWRNKGGVQDLKKARWYLDRLIAHREGAPKLATPAAEPSTLGAVSQPPFVDAYDQVEAYYTGRLDHNG